MFFRSSKFFLNKNLQQIYRADSLSQKKINFSAAAL